MAMGTGLLSGVAPVGRALHLHPAEEFHAQHVFFYISKLTVSADRQAGYSSNPDPLFRFPQHSCTPQLAYTLRPAPPLFADSVWDTI